MRALSVEWKLIILCNVVSRGNVYFLIGVRASTQRGEYIDRAWHALYVTLIVCFHLQRLHANRWKGAARWDGNNECILKNTRRMTCTQPPPAPIP